MQHVSKHFQHMGSNTWEQLEYQMIYSFWVKGKAKSTDISQIIVSILHYLKS